MAAFTNDGSFFKHALELVSEPGAPGTAAHGTDAPAAASSSEYRVKKIKKEENADFIPSSSWQGPKQGFFFGTAEQGTGYIRDVGPKKPGTLAQKVKPAVLKSSSIVKNLPRRNAPVPDPKKRKTEEASTGSKPSYLQEMERYKAMSCSSDTKHDRPLVK